MKCQTLIDTFPGGGYGLGMVQARVDDQQGRLGRHLDRMAPRLSASLAQLRRDLRMVLGDWRGERHPLVARSSVRSSETIRERPPAPDDTEIARISNMAGATAAIGTADTAQPTAGQPAEPAPVHLTIHMGGRAHTIPVAPGQTILEAGLAAGLPMRFSCAMGGCGTCRIKLLSGRVLDDDDQDGLSGCLSDDERRGGYVLACVSRPAASIEPGEDAGVALVLDADLS